MKSSQLMDSNLGWMLAQLPRTTIALAMLREGCRTKDEDLINAVLYSLGEDLGRSYVSVWVVDEAFPALSREEQIFFDSCIEE